MKRNPIINETSTNRAFIGANAINPKMQETKPIILIPNIQIIYTHQLLE